MVYFFTEDYYSASKYGQITIRTNKNIVAIRIYYFHASTNNNPIIFTFYKGSGFREFPRISRQDYKKKNTTIYFLSTNNTCKIQILLKSKNQISTRKDYSKSFPKLNTPFSHRRKEFSKTWIQFSQILFSHLRKHQDRQK